MSFNGSGTFLINSTGQPVVANTVISATVFNALTADLASGLTNCITKDGQSTPTANIPMGSNKITGLANGTLIGDAANLGQVQSTVAKLISITGTDTVVGTMSPTLTAYAAGQLFYFIASGANTGAVTLNVDGLGAKAITRDGSTALAAGDINSGEIVVVIYDGTRFQMINAANSFGNTTINGTLTVTGNTGLQANVSVTSALSVGGTFAVTGAATLGSTLAVTGKSDLPTVSTASANAAVAVITDLSAAGASITSANVGTAVVTTGTVTNLTATSASVASVNAGVALLTTATVTNLTATGASIASANLGNAVISALTLTGVSVASANVGVANITDLRAVGASVTSANLGTAVVTNGTVTNLTATSASVASVNAAVALLTTATVTTLTASGASIASANIGNLQFTAASIASINAGVAVINNLTATSASIASANVGTAVITAGTVTNLTSTAASVASANVGVALITTGTVTSLTATGASVASANVGTAVVTGLTVTNASVASLNAGTATITTGNLNFSSTAQRITGDFSNATLQNQLMLQSSTTNGNTRVSAIPNGTGTVSRFVAYNTATPDTSNSNLSIGVTGTLAEIVAGNGGAGSYLPMTFYTGGSERVRIDTSGNTGFGGTATASTRVEITGTGPSSGGVTRGFRANVTVPSATTIAAANFASSATTEAASFTLPSFQGFAANGIGIGAGSTVTNQYGFIANDSLTGATNNYGFYGNIASGTNRYNVYMAGTADNYFAGNVGIGTASPATILDISATSNPRIRFEDIGDFEWRIGIVDNSSFGFFSGGTVTERMRINSSGNVGIGTASPGAKLDISDGMVRLSSAYQVQWFNGATQLASILGDSGSNLTFQTGSSNTERMRIDSSGNVGIGTASPSTGVHLNRASGNTYYRAQNGTANVDFGVDSAGNGILWNNSNYPLLFGTNNVERVRISAAGLVGVGQGTPNARLDVLADSGDIGRFINSSGTGVSIAAGNNTWTSLSDESVKTDLIPIADAVPKIASLRAVTGRFTSDDVGVSRSFLIAQDVQKVFPEAVNVVDKEKNLLGLAYTDVIPLLVKAVQELTARVAELEAK